MGVQNAAASPGSLQPPRNRRQVWRSACEATEVERIPHDFRRTTVRNLERAGVAAARGGDGWAPHRVNLPPVQHRGRGDAGHRDRALERVAQRLELVKPASLMPCGWTVLWPRRFSGFSGNAIKATVTRLGANHRLRPPCAYQARRPPEQASV